MESESITSLDVSMKNPHDSAIWSNFCAWARNQIIDDRDKVFLELIEGLLKELGGRYCWGTEHRIYVLEKVEFKTEEELLYFKLKFA